MSTGSSAFSRTEGVTLLEAGVGHVDILPRFTRFGNELSRGVDQSLARTEQQATSKLQSFGKTYTRTISPALGAFSLFARSAFQEYDTGIDGIRASTGATGEELERLGDVMEGVGARSTLGLSRLGEVVGDLNTRTGQTGESLEQLALRFAHLEEMGNAASVENVTRLFGDWDVATGKQVETMDQLFRASQATGPSIDQLAQSAVRFGAPLRQMGFDLGETVTLLGKFEKEGVNTNLVIGSMRIALGKLASQGVKDVPAEFRRLVQGIEDAGSAGEANALALEVFGARAGPDMAAAIREGRFDIDALFKQIQNGSETIEKAHDDTVDWGDKLIMLKNRAQAVVGPIGEIGFAAAGIGAGVGPLLSYVGGLRQARQASQALAATQATQTIVQMSRLEVAAASAAAGVGVLSTAMKGLAAAGGTFLAFEGLKTLVQFFQGDTPFQNAEEARTALEGLHDEILAGRASLSEYDALWKAIREEHGEDFIVAAGVTNEFLALEAGRDRLTALAGAFDDSSRSGGRYGRKLEELSRVERRFAGMSGKELKAWLESTNATFDRVGDAIADFGSRWKNTTDDFIEDLQKRAEAANNMKRNIDTAMERGLSPQAVRDILAQGPEAAARVFDDLAKSGRDDIGKVNDGLRDLRDASELSFSDLKRDADKAKGAIRGAGDEVKTLHDRLLDIAAISKLSIRVLEANVSGSPQLGAASGTPTAMAHAAMAAVSGPQVISSGYRPGDLDSFHSTPPPFNAVDIGGSNLPAVFDYLAKKFGKNVRELIYGHTLIEFGQRFHYGPSDHFDHVHLADMGKVIDGPALIAQGRIREAHIPMSGPGADAWTAGMEAAFERALLRAGNPVEVPIFVQTVLGRDGIRQLQESLRVRRFNNRSGRRIGRG